MEITINVKEERFSNYVVERWHEQLEKGDAKGLFDDLIKVSETCSGITSPDLLTNSGCGLNGTHFKQSNKTYDFFCLLKGGCKWSVTVGKRRGYMAYNFTINQQ
jgi:hypothetical protein